MLGAKAQRGPDVDLAWGLEESKVHMWSTAVYPGLCCPLLVVATAVIPISNSTLSHVLSLGNLSCPGIHSLPALTPGTQP